MNKQTKIILSVLGFLVVIAAGVGAAYFFPFQFGEKDAKKTAQDDQKKEDDKYLLQPAGVLAASFGEYKEEPVTAKPQIPDYTVQADLSNVANAEDFSLAPAVEALLIKNAFAVTPSYYEEFFPLYESNRYDYTPSFITTDSMLHNYHLFFGYLLKRLEEEKLIAELKKLNFLMLQESLAQHEELSGTEWENAAKRNVGFFAVGSKLLDPQIEIPAVATNEVSEELALIEAHDAVAKSPVINMGQEEGEIIATPQGELPVDSLLEDYTQYIPRGHYDKTEELKAYFKSMMWYGRLSFRLKNDDEIKSAMLITLALSEPASAESWDKIYEPTNFFVGKSDDITYYQFGDLMKKVYGEDLALKSLSSDPEKFSSFVDETKTLEPPQINSMPIFEAGIQSDREKEIKAFRFMGQRFTLDASIFQRLIYREVGDKTTDCAGFDPEKTSCLTGARCLPKALDIPATLGSVEAKNILEGLDENKYACYSENMSKMNSYVSGLAKQIWTQNLYWGWLYQLRPLLSAKGAGYPAFMQNDAWARKDLNAFLGSWTELKHDTILYAKQVYAELGAGGPEEKDDRGYVEPNPLVYARLAALLKMTSEGLANRGLLSESMEDNLGKLETLAMSLKTISEKELENKTLTDEEYELIRSYGGQLEHFWLEVNKDEPAFKESTSQRDYLDENPAALVADVATDPNGSVLEVGTGKIFEIYAVVPIDGKLRIAKGGVYSYYEFVWPMNDRLTDTKWRAMLDSDPAPELPVWTSAFIAK